jgi:hypothetical protein
LGFGSPKGGGARKSVEGRGARVHGGEGGKGASGLGAVISASTPPISAVPRVSSAPPVSGAVLPSGILARCGAGLASGFCDRLPPDPWGSAGEAGWLFICPGSRVGLLVEGLAGGSDGAGCWGPGPPTSSCDDFGVAGITCHLGGDWEGAGAGYAGGAGVVEVDAVSSFHRSPHLTNVSKATPLACSSFSIRPSAACC